MMTCNSDNGKSAAAAMRAEGLARYRQNYEAGVIGPQVHSRSGRDLPAHRPRVHVDEGRLFQLRNEGLSLRAIAKEMGIGLGTVVRALHTCSNTFRGGSCVKGGA